MAELCPPLPQGRAADPNSGAPAVARHVEAGLRRAHHSFDHQTAKSRS